MILECEDDTIFIVEGEKCADAMLDEDLLATTNSGGAGTGSRSFVSILRDVTLLFFLTMMKREEGMQT